MKHNNPRIEEYELFFSKVEEVELVSKTPLSYINGNSWLYKYENGDLSLDELQLYNYIYITEIGKKPQLYDFVYFATIKENGEYYEIEGYHLYYFYKKPSTMFKLSGGNYMHYKTYYLVLEFDEKHIKFVRFDNFNDMNKFRVEYFKDKEIEEYTINNYTFYKVKEKTK